MERAGWLSSQAVVFSPVLTSQGTRRPRESVPGGLSSLAQASHPGSGLALSSGLSCSPFGSESKQQQQQYSCYVGLPAPFAGNVGPWGAGRGTATELITGLFPTGLRGAGRAAGPLGPKFPHIRAVVSSVLHRCVCTACHPRPHRVLNQQVRVSLESWPNSPDDPSTAVRLVNQLARGREGQGGPSGERGPHLPHLLRTKVRPRRGRRGSVRRQQPCRPPPGSVAL